MAFEDSSCRRLPPISRFAHDNRLVKVALELMLAVTSMGLSELRRMTDASVIRRNSLNPMEVTASINSSATFTKRLSWANLDIGGNRRQELSSNAIDQSFPSIHLTPTTITITPWLTWSPTFSYTNDQRFHQAGGQLLIPGRPGSTVADTLPQFFDDRRTNITIGTPIRLGRW